MTGLAAEGFGKFLLIFLLMNHSAQSMGYLASSFSANPIVGMSIRTCPLVLLASVWVRGWMLKASRPPTLTTPPPPPPNTTNTLKNNTVPLLITPMILFSGMLYERNSVPAGLEWLQGISLVNYGYALMVINQAQYVAWHVGGGGEGGRTNCQMGGKGAHKTCADLRIVITTTPHTCRLTDLPTPPNPHLSQHHPTT